MPVLRLSQGSGDPATQIMQVLPYGSERSDRTSCHGNKQNLTSQAHCLVSDRHKSFDVAIAELINSTQEASLRAKVLSPVSVDSSAQRVKKKKS